jgi:hypothetical protein
MQLMQIVDAYHENWPAAQSTQVVAACTEEYLPD